MNNLQPYEPEMPYQFPTSLHAQRGGLTPYQKQQHEIDFVNHVAFQRRRIVTIVVTALCVGLFVAHVLKHGINGRALFATLVAVAVAFTVRNYSIPKR